ncbi:capsular polysaccharide biosynthsis protein, partial [unidentified eubacterium SCB49]
MKHVVFVIESLGLGGAEKSLVTLLQNIDYTAYNVDLILFKKEGIFKKLIPDNVNVKYVTMPKLGLIDRLRFKLLKMTYPNHHAAQLFWKIIKNKFDVIDVDYDAAIAYNQGLVTY